MEGDVGVEDQGAHRPLGALLGDAVTAVPPTGGAITSMVAQGVAIVITTILDVAWVA